MVFSSLLTPIYGYTQRLPDRLPGITNIVTKERSRSYPVLDLEMACQALTGKLSRMGSSRLDRDAFAETLGYSSAKGGIAARKVSALVQYGLIEYRDGFYELSARGHRIQSFKVGTQEFLKAARVALEKPPLFRSLLSRYRPLGQIPEDLAKVLAEQYGITARASEDAEGVFVRSAVFAGVLDTEGRFRESPQGPILAERTSASSVQHQARAERRPPFLFSVSEGRAAALDFPLDISAKDLEILEKRLRFEIENGTLWDYLGLKKPVANPAQSSVEEQAPTDTGNVVPIRPLREG